MRAIISASEDRESRQGLSEELGVTTEGERGPLLWLCTFRTGAALMDGPRLKISWRAWEQDAGGGLWCP